MQDQGNNYNLSNQQLLQKIQEANKSIFQATNNNNNLMFPNTIQPKQQLGDFIRIKDFSGNNLLQNSQLPQFQNNNNINNQVLQNPLEQLNQQQAILQQQQEQLKTFQNQMKLKQQLEDQLKLMQAQTLQNNNNKQINTQKIKQQEKPQSQLNQSSLQQQLRIQKIQQSFSNNNLQKSQQQSLSTSLTNLEKENTKNSDILQLSSQLQQIIKKEHVQDQSPKTLNIINNNNQYLNNNNSSQPQQWNFSNQNNNNTITTTNDICQQIKQQQQQQLLIQSQKNPQQGSLMTCELHKGCPLDFVCQSNFCIKQKLNCSNCVANNHNQHDIIPVSEYIQNIKEIEGNIKKNIITEQTAWDKIQLIVENNCKYLVTLEQLVKQLASNCQKLQNTLKIVQEKQTTEQLDLQKKIGIICNRFKNNLTLETKQQMTDINQLVQSLNKFKTPIIMDIPQIIESIDFNCQFSNFNEQNLKDSAFYIGKSQEIQMSLEKHFQYTEFSIMNQMKKVKNEQEINSKMSRVFHLVKGKAKKRDILNFVNWDDEKRELKFLKDIKEKEENSHYQLVFSVCLKNLEILNGEQIDEDLLQWLNLIIINEYPKVKKQKEDQRKTINTKDGTNKRKYCKFNPRINVDLNSYIQNPGQLPNTQSSLYGSTTDLV